MSESFSIGDPCPKCGKPLERSEEQFYWRGESRDGAVCASCNALWPIKGEEIAPLRAAPFGNSPENP